MNAYQEYKATRIRIKLQDYPFDDVEEFISEFYQNELGIKENIKNFKKWY